jgi:phosphoglucomutase
MKVSSIVGKPAEPAMLVNVPGLVTAYYSETPDASVPEQRVARTSDLNPSSLPSPGD